MKKVLWSVVFMGLYILLPSWSRAEWEGRLWNPMVRVCDSMEVYNSQIAPDGTGGALFVWEDKRRGAGASGSDIYAQKLDVDGNFGWQTDGVLVAYSEGGGDPAFYNNQITPLIVSDGEGGAVILWVDDNSLSQLCDETTVRLQRLDENGDLMWGDDITPNWGFPWEDTGRGKEGIPLCTEYGGQAAGLTEWSNGTRGIFALWGYDTSCYGRKRYKGFEIPYYPATPQGYIHSGSCIVDAGKGMIRSSAGGIFLTWEQMVYGPGNDETYVAKLWSPDENTWSAMLPEKDAFYPVICEDGSGGMIVSWYKEPNTESQYDVFANRVSSDGCQWGPGGYGIEVCALDGSKQRDPEIVSDGSGGAIIAWMDYREPAGYNAAHIYAQRVDHDGNFLWQTDGIKVSANMNCGEDPVLVSTSDGAIVIFHNDDHIGDADPPWDPTYVYAVKLENTGSIAWGKILFDANTAYGYNTYGAISDANDGAIVYVDCRLRTTRVLANGTIVNAPSPTPPGYHTPTPTPTVSPTPEEYRTPTPTPLRPIIDSGDYNGDGTSDIAIFRESSGLWAVRGITRVYFGTSGDIPISGDYNGDGSSDISIFRHTSGLWAVKGVTRVYFGSSSDTAVPGDYDGNGSCNISICRATSGLWAIRGVTRVYFGGATDEPVPGYYNGDGVKDIGIFRESSGLWALRNISRLYFGSSGDNIVPGDYNGDGTWDCGIFRPLSGLWAIRGVTRSYFGSSSDQPIPADYNGSGVDSIGIFRDTSGLWALRGISRVYYGTSGDIPVTR